MHDTHVLTPSWNFFVIFPRPGNIRRVIILLARTPVAGDWYTCWLLCSEVARNFYENTFGITYHNFIIFFFPSRACVLNLPCQIDSCPLPLCVEQLCFSVFSCHTCLTGTVMWIFFFFEIKLLWWYSSFKDEEQREFLGGEHSLFSQYKYEIKLTNLKWN